jgi:tripartite ATP-independent transporter DctP family solute receptor
VSSIKSLAAGLVCLALTGALCHDGAQAAQYTIKFGYENSQGEPFDLGVREWARLVKEKTNGQVIIQPFPNSQLGSKKDIMEQMKLGAPVGTLSDGAFFADFGIPDFAILMGPYLGDGGYKDIIKLADTPWFEGLVKQLDDYGIHIIAANWLYGERHMVTKKPVRTPADLKGMKIRVPNTQIQIKAMAAMGATPTPMPLGEVYTALNTGVIDGAENPIPALYGLKLYEPTKHLILTGHLDNVTNLIVSKKYFDKLPPDIQKAIVETCKTAGDYMTAQLLKAEKENVEAMKAQGVTVIEVDRKLFRDAARATYSQFPDWTPGLYEKLQGYLKK